MDRNPTDRELERLRAENARLRLGYQLFEVLHAAADAHELLAGALSVLVDSEALGVHGETAALLASSGAEPVIVRSSGSPETDDLARRACRAVLAGEACEGSDRVVPLLAGDVPVGALWIGFDPTWAGLVHDLARRVGEGLLRLHDTAALREAATELSAARDGAVAASRAKSSFLEQMSHELRTPLNAVIGYTDILLEDAQERGWRDAVQDLERVRAAGNRLTWLVSAILDLARAEAGRVDLELETFSLADLLEEVLTVIRPQVPRGVDFEIDADSELGEIRTDRDKLKQVVTNVLGNALKFTDPAGSVSLAVRRSAGDTGDMVTLSVTDTGIGISDEHLAELFEPFYQVDTTSTRRHGGAGLGLALSRMFCRLMGGDVEVSSVAGQGSTFTIHLPAVSGPVPGARVGDASADTVLVVDDDPLARNLLERALTRKGYRVITAANAVEALRLARQVRPIAVTLDVVMPQMDGWTALAHLKSDPETASIPVIFVTMIDDRSKGFALGASDVMTKPFDFDRLLGTLAQYRGSTSWPKVLVLDDDAPTRHVLRRALERQGWSTVEARSGVEGLERLGEHVPQAIVLDLNMPEMDGFEFLSRVRSVDAWSAIPIVVVTAIDPTETETQQLRHSFVHHVLRKSASGQEQLLHEVVRLIRAAVVHTN